MPDVDTGSMMILSLRLAAIGAVLSTAVACATSVDDSSSPSRAPGCVLMNYVEGRDLIGSRDYASDLAAAYAARDLAHLEVPYLRLVGRSPELESLPTRSYFEFDEDQVDRQPDSITVAQTAPGVWRVESLHGCVPYPA